MRPQLRKTRGTVIVDDINGERSEDELDISGDEEEEAEAPVDDDEYSSSEEDSSSDEGEEMEVDDERRRVVKWRKRPVNFLPAKGPKVEALPGIYNADTPLDFFSLFFTPDLFHHILRETERYAGQQRLSKAPVIHLRDIEKYIGAILLMGVIQMSGTRNYWAGGTRISQIADYMTRATFEKVKRYIHFCDNQRLKKQGEEGYHPLQKVRPVLEMFLAEIRKVPQENRVSVDEMVIPFKGRSHLKQYNPKKPKKWGYKAQALCGSSGFLYNLEIYCGKHSEPCRADEPDLGASSNVVVRMLRYTPRNIDPKVFFDNWFASIPLLVYLKNQGIASVCTVRRDRLPGATLPTDAELKKAGRGAFVELGALSGGVEISVVKWQDKGAVHLASTYVSAEPVGSCQRFDKKKKETVTVDRPNIVNEYNSFMGGVDLIDMLLALYRIKVRSSKYYMRIFYHIVNLCVVNAWILYKRSRQQFHPAQSSKLMQLADFQVQVSEALLRRGSQETKKSRGRPSLEDRLPVDPPTRTNVEPHPVTDVRRDNLDHWPAYVPQGRCRYPGCGGYSTVECEKCKMRLCFTSKKNCLKNYHKE